MSQRAIQHVLVLLITSATIGFGQQDRGTFTGTVTDPAGASVPNVKVGVVNTQTNATYNSVTNEAGQYTVPNLPVGQYRIRFEGEGFKATVREGLTLNVAQVAR